MASQVVRVPKSRTRTSQASSVDEYEAKTRRSKKMYLDARKVLAGGQSHNARFFEPYPFYASRAKGKYIWDVDNNRYVDYWMGHTALILGHSPRVVSEVLAKQIRDGLLFGTANKYAVELAELVSSCVPCAESIRFCTTGAEATMYAVRLARAHTKRKQIVKMAGGWHGYNSSLSVGVSFPYEVPESAGLDPSDEHLIRLARFNDIDSTIKLLSTDSSDIAAVILEPMMGAGGVLPADVEYLKALREQCDRIGALLIFDEIITGFRLALGGAQEYYGIEPDLCTLGKILGGGLPASAVAGKSEILQLVDMTAHRPKQERCWIGGGTFSEQALSMRAGIATLDYLRKRKNTIYPSIGKLGDQLRKEIDKKFAEHGIASRSTGAGSLFATHFLKRGQNDIRSPQDVISSDEMMTKRYYFSLISNHGIFFLPGHIGAVSTCHTKSDVDYYVKSTEIVADRLNSERSESNV
jgi:glutamate-1-semialdehyde 2,1-aminomutase